MRSITVPFLDKPVSSLGLGCASLGSRIAPDQGRAAIERALDAGVTWFDVAPSYGDGQAESLLGRALGPRAPHVAIVTKVGLVANPPGPAKRLVGRLARPLVAMAPGLRGLAKRLRPDVARRVVLTPDLIRDSLLRSLDRLGVERIALLALHEPSHADVTDPNVIETLEALKAEGLCAAVGVAGDLDVFAAGRAAGAPFEVLQTSGSVFDRIDLRLAALPQSLRPSFLVTHSVFGVGGALDRARSRPEIAARYPGHALSEALLDAAFAANPAGVVLTSAYAPGHIAQNAAVAARQPEQGRLDQIAALLGDGRQGSHVAGEPVRKPERERDGEERRVRLA